jgi:2,4-diaminopentanoate dehydrogenase
MAYRVIQWGTGYLGKAAVRMVGGRDDLELVGARVFSPEKVGVDVGELSGMGPLGIEATDDEEALLALEADCVLWMGAYPMTPASSHRVRTS